MPKMFRKPALNHFYAFRNQVIEQKGPLLTDYSRAKLGYVLKGPCIPLRVGVPEHYLHDYKCDVESSCWSTIFTFHVKLIMIFAAGQNCGFKGKGVNLVTKCVCCERESL